jgi:hypothetical protein
MGTLQSAPCQFKLQTHLPLSNRPLPLHSTGQALSEQSNPEKPAKHSHLPFRQSPFPLQLIGHLEASLSNHFNYFNYFEIFEKN